MKMLRVEVAVPGLGYLPWSEHEAPHRLALVCSLLVLGEEDIRETHGGTSHGCVESIDLVYCVELWEGQSYRGTPYCLPKGIRDSGLGG